MFYIVFELRGKEKSPNKKKITSLYIIKIANQQGLSRFA